MDPCLAYERIGCDKLQVLLATSADVPRIARIFYDAFARTTIYLTIFADVTPEDQIACNELRLYKEVEDPTRQVLKAVVGDEIVAFAVWSIPHEKIAQPEVDEATKEEQERQRFPEGTNLELARRFFAQGRLGVEGLHYRETHLSSSAACPFELTPAT